MTDRDAISDLVHRYADAVVHFNGDQWGDGWAEDARWILSAERDVNGREAIVALWHKAMGGFDAVIQNVLNSTASVAPDGQTASGRSYICEHFRRANGVVGILLAHYEDTYVKVDGDWKFASRQLFPHYQGAPDLSGTFFNVMSTGTTAP